MVLTQAHLLEIYQLDYLSGIMEGTSKKIAILHNVGCFYETKNGIAIVALNSTLKVILWKEIEALTA